MTLNPLQVQHYAENTKTCRHVAICRYFGEKIDETDAAITELYCQKMCDVSTPGCDDHALLNLLPHQVCAHPEKVALRASHLTEDVIIASQVPKRKECDLDSLAPVNSVNFYNLDVRQALAVPPIPATEARTLQPEPPVPAPRPAAKIQPIPQVNPYAAAVSAPMSSARRPFGLSANSNRAPQPSEPKQRTYVIVEDRPVKPGKKVKTVEASPYAASPSLAGAFPGFYSVRF